MFQFGSLENSARLEIYTRGRLDERARIEQIICSEEAKSLQPLAIDLAIGTALNARHARRILEAVSHKEPDDGK